jgi:hypothetical protein
VQVPGGVVLLIGPGVAGMSLCRNVPEQCYRSALISTSAESGNLVAVCFENFSDSVRGPIPRICLHTRGIVDSLTAWYYESPRGVLQVSWETGWLVLLSWSRYPQQIRVGAAMVVAGRGERRHMPSRGDSSVGALLRYSIVDSPEDDPVKLSRTSDGALPA